MTCRRMTGMGPTRGFSVVELMVALAISSVMVLGVSAMFLSTREAYQVQDAISELQENGRLAVNRLAREVRMTGYRADNWASGPLPNALTATNGASDRLSVTYAADFDCNRVAAPADGFVTNTFDVAGGGLRCNNVLMFDGVEEMQVFFAEDTDGDGVANRLLDPETPGLQLERVVSVNLNLLVAATDNQVATGEVALTPELWNAKPGSDGRVRREFSITVALRNPL